MRSLATAYLDDPDLRRAANARGENYWDAYLAEIAEQLGLFLRQHPLTAGLGSPLQPDQPRYPFGRHDSITSPSPRRGG